VLLTALFGAAALCATGFALWQMRDGEIEASARHLSHMVRGLAEQTAREIADADQDLLRMIGAARLQPERLREPEQRERVMARNVSSITQAAALAFVDGSGRRSEYVRPSASSAPPAFPPAASADGLIIRDGADREPPGMFLQRTLWLDGGGLGGVVLARLSEDFVAGIFRAWRGEIPATVALATTQGRELLQYPAVEGSQGKTLAALSAARGGSRVAAVAVRYSDPVDGRTYLLASEAVPDFPLVVHAWVAEKDVLAQWLSQGALLAGATLALVLIALFLARRHAAELGQRAAAIGRMQDLQSALAAEEAKLQTIVRTVPSAVFQARLTERRTVALSFMSAQIETLWAMSPEAVVHAPRRALWKVPRAHRRQLVECLSEAVLQGSGWDVTVPVQAAHGMRWLRIHAAPGHEPEVGRATVWDGIISDVTEQKLAERQVVLLNLDLERRVVERTQELAELNKELEAFTDSVSHDLRAPLRGIRGYAEILRSGGELPGEAGALVERIIAQGGHMEQLIEALLELSQLSRYALTRISVDMTDIASATLQELQARDPARSVRWTVQPGLRAHADPRLVRVLFENLLGNAWKFTRDRADATIEVGSTVPRSGRSVYFVRDNGAGFDPQYAERLFRPFQRLHPASRFEGTGIGLATVQRIIHRHAGRIWAESRPGEGATFYFELPMENHSTRAA
jgi:signal transduction histidine kinase